MGRQMPQRDEEFHQVVTELEHICDVNDDDDDDDDERMNFNVA